MADQVFHRPGPLKQSNKTHKTGRHRSKGAIDNALKGLLNYHGNLHFINYSVYFNYKI